MNITLIGAGNVGWHLAIALEKAGHKIVEVYSRQLENATKLCEKLYDTIPTQYLDFTQSKAELFILAVRDDSLREIIPQICLPEKALIAHTSGSQPLEIFELLSPKSGDYGVFYPLQTFSKQTKVSKFTDIPFCIEGNNAITEKKLFWLAEELSEKVFLVDSAQRKILHVAAVFACNFTNHLLALADEILQKEKLPFDLLKPLIQETFQKALATDPKTAQTGPARRQDVETISNHLAYLQSNPVLSSLYEQLSRSIIDYYKQEEKK